MELAEIQAAIAAKPELKTGLIGALRDDVLTVLKSDGFYRTKAEEEAFLANYEQTIIPSKVEAEIGGKIKEVYDRLDQEIFEATGLKKGPHEKTYEFNKRVIAKLKADAAAGTGGDDALKQQLQAAQQALEEKKDYVPKSELEKLQSDYFKDKVQNKLSGALEKRPIGVPAHVTDEAAKQQYIDTQRRFIIADFQSRFTAKTDKDGNVVYFEGDKMMTNTATAKPMTEAEILAKNYEGYFVPEKAPKTGAGSGKGNADDNGVDGNEADLKTKEAVTKHLQGKNLVVGSAAFNKEYKRILTEQGITD